MRVAVCELPPEMEPGSAAWQELAARVRSAKPALLLLNEMPFGPWIAAGEEPDAEIFERSRLLHEKGVARFQELGATVVLGTRPTRHGERQVNEAFVWTKETGLTPAHTKQYFPNEEGYYEARWFTAGERHFRVAEAGPARVGFLICTEIMFNEHARRYGRQGAQLIAVPRAVGRASLPRWLVAMQMAALVSGCYVITSNRGGRDSRGQTFGGCGWVIDPGGEKLAQTSKQTPVVFYDLDLEAVARAQREYPCYVPELG
jgi:N-carbamoylputrescine amidase